MSFEEISHTADVKIQVRALTLTELFSDTFSALMEIVYGPDRKGCLRKEIDVEAENTESLMTDFLSEALFISEVDGIVFSHATIRIDGLHLTAILEGELFDQNRHSGGSEVKGISYSGLSILHNANGYMMDIIFDV